MDRMTARNLASDHMRTILQAYADGKPIEHFSKRTGWEERTHLYFGGKPEFYRIKQEPVIRYGLLEKGASETFTRFHYLSNNLKEFDYNWDREKLALYKFTGEMIED